MTIEQSNEFVTKTLSNISTDNNGLMPLVKEISGSIVSRPGTKKDIPNPAMCQVDTPLLLVRKFWELLHKHRAQISTVIDLGAGDGRFASHGRFDFYVGYEIDPRRLPKQSPHKNARIVNTCVLDAIGQYDAAVGNPPYIRNQDLNPDWVHRAQEIIFRETGEKINGLSNLYLYFMWLAVIRTKTNGIIGFIVPFEWVYRPSAKSLRRFAQQKGWSISIYRLPESRKFFSSVQTTSSITIIDKAAGSYSLNIYSIDENLFNSHRKLFNEISSKVFEFLPHRGTVYAMRGLSPGSQNVFTLTEAERKNASIGFPAVVPCVTSLRNLPSHVIVLTKKAFKDYFIDANRKCWLIRTDLQKLPSSVQKWLSNAPESIKNNSTCQRRTPWYYFRTPPVPKILCAAGFKKAPRPKIVLNEVGARNVGSIHGIFGPSLFPHPLALLRHLRSLDFTQGTFPLAYGLRKIEVNQMNGILYGFYENTHAPR